jgi:hypothetical protein
MLQRQLSSAHLPPLDIPRFAEKSDEMMSLLPARFLPDGRARRNGGG